MAHLLPAGPNDADTWWFMPSMLLGEQITTFRQQRLAIHGMKRPEETNRIQHVGIKHFAANKARILGQGRHMDQNPHMLVVPILNQEQVRNWNGTAYDAIVVIDTFDDDFDFLGIANETGMVFSGEEATVDEIEVARDLLEKALKAMHYAVSNLRPQDLQQQDRRIVATRGITVPRRLVDYRCTVRKVSFRNLDMPQNTEVLTQHIAPDPMLLVCKAGVVFSTRHGQRLAAGAEPEDDWSERDYMEMERVLEIQEAQLRPPDDWNELGRRLGQPNGYRGAGA